MRNSPFSTVLLLALLGACSSSGLSDDMRDSIVAGTIQHGRELLDSGKPAQAEVVFTEAAEADENSLRTRMWVLRAWMDQGRSNDTLDALDTFDKAGEEGVEMTYLYGMAFARRAEGYQADGVTDSSVHMNFLDATDFLQQALAADPLRYHDAYLPLANAAWYVQELEVARDAADHAVEINGTPEAWLTRGRIAMTQFTTAEAEEPGGSEAEGAWSAASESFARAVQLYGQSEAVNASADLAQAATQLGHAMVWRKKGPEATEAYATAIASEPMLFNYPQAIQFMRSAPKQLDDERESGFRAALEKAHTDFAQRAAFGETATLLWWLGWARFVDADWAGSEMAFLGTLALAPEYANSWFYVGLARQYQGNSLGALLAMQAGWEQDPTAMVAAAASAGGALRALEQLLGWCAGQVPARYMDAAFLAELLSEAMPGEARHWNNMGLFLRDEGERMELRAFRAKTEVADPELLADLYQRSYTAYQRALELNPTDPQLVNDTALMQQYHLGGKPEETEPLYHRAIELANLRLAEEGLSDFDRLRFETTVADAESNLEHMHHPKKARAKTAKLAAEAAALMAETAVKAAETAQAKADAAAKAAGEATPQGDAVPEDAVQGDAAQGDAAQEDAVQGDAAQEDAEGAVANGG